MELFDKATISALRDRGDKLTSTFEELLKKSLGEKISVITPKDRGSMLCLRFKDDPKRWMKALRERNVHLDFREPDIIRATPAPLYNSYEDVFSLVKVLEELSQG